MTDDLKARLRQWSDQDCEYGHIGRAEDIQAAADRIEALEAALQYARNLIGPDEIVDAALAGGGDE